MSTGKNFPHNLFITREGSKSKKIEDAGKADGLAWWNKDPYALMAKPEDGQRIEEPFAKSILGAVSYPERAGEAAMGEPTELNPFVLVPLLFYYSKRVPFSPGLVARLREKDCPVRLTDISGREVEIISRTNGHDASFLFSGVVYGKNGDVLEVRSYDREGGCKDGDVKHMLVGHDSTPSEDKWEQAGKLFLTVDTDAKGQKTYHWWTTDPLKAAREKVQDAELKVPVSDYLVAQAKQKGVIPEGTEPSAIAPLVVSLVYSFSDRRVRFDESLVEKSLEPGSTLKIEDYDGSQVCIVRKRNGANKEYVFSGVVLSDLGEPLVLRSYNAKGECSDKVWGHTIFGVSGTFQKKAGDRTEKSDESAEAVAEVDRKA